MISARLCIALWALAALVYLKGCESVNADIDLSTLTGPTGFAIHGAIGADYSGHSVSSLGDVNGDAIDDVVIGAYSADPTVGATWRGDAGITYVIFGRISTSGASSYADITLSAFNTAGSPLGFAIFGANDYDHSGQTVGTAGDVNGDGIADILLGSPGIDPVVNSVTRTDAGATYIVFGRNKSLGPSSYLNVDLATFTSAATAQGFRIIGAATAAQSGYALAGGGDVNKDGIADIIVGAYGGDPVVGGVMRGDAGISYVIFGRATYTNIDLASFASGGSTVGFSILGAVTNDQSGTAVGAAGDVNNDGVGDILVGTFLAGFTVNGETRTTVGVAYVIFGRDKLGGAAAYSDVDLLQFQSGGTALGFAIIGSMTGDASGASVRGAGDVNDDGVEDIVVGGSGASPSINSVWRGNAGITYVIFGRKADDGASAYTNVDLRQFFAAGTPFGFAIYGEVLSDCSGFSAQNAGDVNGDGISDVVIGAYFADVVIGATTKSDSGKAYVVYGRSFTRGAAAYSNIDLALVQYYGYRILGAASNDRTGWSVSGAGDVNKDGLKDVLVSAYLANNAAGISYVIFGAIATPTSQPSSQPSRQPSSQPVSRPSSQPTCQPSSRPSCQPSTQPSTQPTRQPMACPTSRPTVQSSARPSSQPTRQPQGTPSSQPSSQPSTQPTSQPSAQPTVQPSRLPTTQPSVQPTMQPSGQPSAQPTTDPSAQPQAYPSSAPSGMPSSQPTAQPSFSPSAEPSAQPSQQPSSQPSAQPTRVPSGQPSVVPTCQPTSRPSTQPTMSPSAQPTGHPSSCPSSQPSATPTTQPSSHPSNQPSAHPSTTPTAAPSTQPSANPSAQPTTQPSSNPSVNPTRQPTSRPTCVPSRQPSNQPTVQPTSRPSGVPSHQPTARPSLQPSAQPSSVPTVQPSQQPRASPSSQPTATPTVQPTLPPTGEWVAVLSNNSSVQSVFYAGDVWVCGQQPDRITSVCTVSDADAGTIASSVVLPWSQVTSVFPVSNANSAVVIVGRNFAGQTTRSSDIALCSVFEEQVQCAVVSNRDTRYVAAVYVPYPKKYVYVGWCNVYTCVTIHDTSTNVAQSYVYTAYNIKSLALTHLQSPPAFVGAFVTGTAVRATATPVNYIVAGMVRTEAGIMGGMIIMPQIGDIVNSVDLVTTMALENTGPDTFIAGGLLLDDNAGKHAYLVRANALFMNIAYCVRYRSDASGRRRALDSPSEFQSIVRGMVLVDTCVYMAVDRLVDNTTSVTLLKATAASGAIVKQVHLTVHNATSLECSSIASAPPLLVLVCGVTRHNTYPQSVLLSINYDFALAVLPVGFVRSDDSFFVAESVPFKRTVLTVTKSDTKIAASTYEFTTTNHGPTRSPTLAPVTHPTAQPTSTPSAQPSSSPTVAPSISARPTSQPSSATPTNTQKPSPKPTVVPTYTPSVMMTTRPTQVPTAMPSHKPTSVPTKTPTTNPSANPSAPPTRTPRTQPTTRPTRSPTPAPTRAPSVLGTIEETADVVGSGGSSMPSYVVGVSVGGGLGALLLCYMWYKYEQHHQEEKAKELRRVDYHAKQAILIAEAHAEMKKFLQREAALLAERKEQKRLEKLHKCHETKQKKCRGGGAYAVSPVVRVQETPLHVPSRASSRSASTNISSLHTSERSDDFESESGCEKQISESEQELNSSDYSAFADDLLGEMEANNSRTSDSLSDAGLDYV